MGHASLRPVATGIATVAVLLAGLFSDSSAAGTPPNRAPVISGAPVATVMPGQSYDFVPTASDPDRDSLRFQIANRPRWARFDRQTGRLAGTPSSADIGVNLNIRISVSDGSLVAALPPFTITVGNTSTGNRAPTISGSPAIYAREGQAYAFTPQAADADGNRLSFSIVNPPSWVTLNATSGSLTGTPGLGSVGIYPNITIRVSDGVTSTALPAFTITVLQSALGSATLFWTAPATRTDGSALTNLAGYRIRYGTASGSYPNMITISNPGLTTAVISNLPPATYYFVLSAYDSNGLESQNTSPVAKTIR